VFAFTAFTAFGGGGERGGGADDADEQPGLLGYHRGTPCSL
jgi:hypothetical protein